MHIFLARYIAEILIIYKLSKLEVNKNAFLYFFISIGISFQKLHGKITVTRNHNTPKSKLEINVKKRFNHT